MVSCVCFGGRGSLIAPTTLPTLRAVPSFWGVTLGAASGFAGGVFGLAVQAVGCIGACAGARRKLPGSPGWLLDSEVVRKGGKPHGGWRDFFTKFVPDSVGLIPRSTHDHNEEGASVSFEMCS
jgi:hypothetical protein